MADRKISELPSIFEVKGATEFPVNEAGTTKKCTMTQIATFAGIGAASTSAAGLIEIATQAEQATGSDTGRVVVSGRQQYHPSAAKFWAKVTGNSTTILASYNMTSWADTAVGDADGTIATDFSTANWAGLVSVLAGTTAWDATNVTACGFNAQAAGTFGVLCSQMADGGTSVANLFDPTNWFVAGFGVQV